MDKTMTEEKNSRTLKQDEAITIRTESRVHETQFSVPIVSDRAASGLIPICVSSVFIRVATLLFFIAKFDPGRILR